MGSLNSNDPTSQLKQRSTIDSFQLEKTPNSSTLSESDSNSPCDVETSTTTTTTTTTTTQSKPKRLQAQRACSNCKRLHAKCDNERPCKRCVQNGLSNTCVDLPRKRRMSRTYTDTNNSVNKMWEARFNSMISTPTIPLSNITPMSPPSSYPYVPIQVGKEAKLSVTPPMQQRIPQSVPQNGFGYHPSTSSKSVPSMVELSTSFEPNLVLTEIMNPVEQEVMRHRMTHRETTSHHYSQGGGGIPDPFDRSMDNFIYQQMSEIRETNSHLERKLLSPELEMRERISRQSPQWYSFVPQQDFAISVWQGTGTPGHNYLAECNERFVELTGFSMDQLRNNFPTQKLFINKQIYASKEWPKRTQIATAYGLKEVYLTIYPLVSDLTTNKYFIVNMLEINNASSPNYSHPLDPAHVPVPPHTNLSFPDILKNV